MGAVISAIFELAPVALPLTALVMLTVGLAGGWLWLGQWPRRQRAARRIERLLQQQNWPLALPLVRALHDLGSLPPHWQERVRGLEAECHQLAGAAALAEQRFEDSFDHYQTAGRLRNGDIAAERARVVDGMLAEVRRLFAVCPGAQVAEALALLARTLQIEPCPEALFWRGLCEVRAGKIEAAVASLRESTTTPPRAGAATPADPFLYLGALLLRRGQVQEALRYLSSANRLQPDCPFVSWQLGAGIVAAGGDSLAVRALQRALGPQGLPLWIKTPRRAWIEGFPEKTGVEPTSYVRRLAEKHPYHCPLWGIDVASMVRQAQAALAHAQYRLGHFLEAAELYQAVLQESPPTMPLLRGLGLALARLGRHDQAFKHLRAAFEQEEPKDHRTAGYLALCGARGKPNRPEDKANNIAWAIRLLSRFAVLGDAETAGLWGAVFAEARAQRVPIALEDQQRLCSVLASADAVDASAGAAYADLAAANESNFSSTHAWLFSRALIANGAPASVAPWLAVALLARTCREQEHARPYFVERHWDFDEVELAFLQRLAMALDESADPATLLSELGLAEQGALLRPAQEELLLARSRAQEAAGDLEGALASVALLQRLSPRNGAALDRLAYLSYRRGDLEHAAEFLDAWHALAPDEPLPLLRLAIVEQQRGRAVACFEAVAQARERTRGRARAAVAFLGARLSLAELARTAPAQWLRDPLWNQALDFLQLCRAEDPEHTGALGCLALMLARARQRSRLAALTPLLDRPELDQRSFAYLAAVCRLAAGDAAVALQACARGTDQNEEQAPASGFALWSAVPFDFAEEFTYLVGWARLLQGESAAAVLALQAVAAQDSRSPSANRARALLGQSRFAAGDHAGAARWWSGVDASQRAAWGLDQPLRDTVLLTALQALRDGRFEQALDTFAEVGRLGWNDRRLGPLMNLARIKAARQLLADDDTRSDDGEERAASSLLDPRSAQAEAAVWFLRKAVQAGCREPGVALLLARAHQRLQQAREARAALHQVDNPNADVWLQLGLLSLRDKPGGPVALLHQAEQEFERARQLGEAERGSAATQRAATYNLLLTRLSLGKLDDVIPLVPALLELTSAPEEQRRLALLAILLQSQAHNREERFILILAEMADADEHSVLEWVRGLGNLDMTTALLRTLSAARPHSPAVLSASCESALLRARALLERCQPTQAEQTLTPLVGPSAVLEPSTRAALLNLLGCCACLNQNFAGGNHYFAAALQIAGNDPRLEQNLALACEFQGFFDRAEPHWNHYLDLLDGRLPVPPGQVDAAANGQGRQGYCERLAFACLSRLAQRHHDQEKWARSLDFFQRAHRLRPDDSDILERLFQVNNQLRRFDDARRALECLRRLRADVPHLELYELELVEVKGIDDVERLLHGIDRILQKHPEDAAVVDRAGVMVANLVAYLAGIHQQYHERLRKTARTVQRLPSHQINWPDVNDYVRELRLRLQKFLRAIDHGLPLARSDPARRQLLELRPVVEEDIELCRSLGG